MMADIMMEDREIEEMQSLPMNLEVITLYTFRDYYLLEPNQKETKIRSNLVINKKTSEITERSKSEPIDENYSERNVYSAFFGMLTVLSKTFLFLVRTCEKACTI